MKLALSAWVAAQAGSGATENQVGLALAKIGNGVFLNRMFDRIPDHAYFSEPANLPEPTDLWAELVKNLPEAIQELFKRLPSESLEVIKAALSPSNRAVLEQILRSTTPAQANAADSAAR